MSSERGIYQKYKVTRSDKKHHKGKKHEHCQYFVLDLTHDPHAIPALQAYAKSCRRQFPRLADDILNALDYDPPNLDI